jgi:hypothetical protein
LALLYSGIVEDFSRLLDSPSSTRSSILFISSEPFILEVLPDSIDVLLSVVDEVSCFLSSEAVTSGL